MATTCLGKVCVTPRGEYNEREVYERLDIVSYFGKVYIVLKDVTGVTPTEGEYYSLLIDNASSTLTGTEDKPIILRELENGIYVLNGYVKGINTDEAFEYENEVAIVSGNEAVTNVTIINGARIDYYKFSDDETLETAGKITRNLLDAYSKKEIDDKLSGSLTYAGIATCMNYTLDPLQGSKPREIYTMVSEGGSVSCGGHTNIAIQDHYEMGEGKIILTIDRTEYDDLIFAGAAGVDNYFGIGLKTSTNQYSDQPITLQDVSIEAISNTYIELVGSVTYNMEDYENIDWSQYEIKYMDYSMEISKGQGLIWTGIAWITI